MLYTSGWPDEDVVSILSSISDSCEERDKWDVVLFTTFFSNIKEQSSHIHFPFN